MRVHFFLDEQKDKPTYKYRDLDWIPRIGEAIHFGGTARPHDYRANNTSTIRILYNE